MKTFQNVKNVHTIVRNILPLKNRKLTSHNCKCYIEIHIFFFKYLKNIHEIYIKQIVRLSFFCRDSFRSLGSYWKRRSDISLIQTLYAR